MHRHLPSACVRVCVYRRLGINEVHLTTYMTTCLLSHHHHGMAQGVNPLAVCYKGLNVLHYAARGGHDNVLRNVLCLLPEDVRVRWLGWVAGYVLLLVVLLVVSRVPLHVMLRVKICW